MQVEWGEKGMWIWMDRSLMRSFRLDKFPVYDSFNIYHLLSDPWTILSFTDGKDDIACIAVSRRNKHILDAQYMF
jgi:hypothetical protein